MNSIDARGLSCPQPSILVREAIKAGKFPIEVEVDSATSRENVRRLAENMECKVIVTQTKDGYKLMLSR